MDLPDESLPTHSYCNVLADCSQHFHVAEQLQVVIRGLPEPESRIDPHPGYPSHLTATAVVEQTLPHFGNDIFIGRVVLHTSRFTLHMHCEPACAMGASYLLQ